MQRSLPRHAAALAACLGVTAAVGAAPALASPTYESGGNLYGSGSSLQKVAQVGSSAQDWAGLTALWHTNIANQTWTSGSGEGGPTGSFALSGDPSATYYSSSSGSGLGEFGDSGSGVTLANDPNADALSPPELDGFIGSDDPPTTTDLSDGSSASNGVSQVTVPVFQAPIAIILSLPADLTLGTGAHVDLTNKLLQQIYAGDVQAAGGYDEDTWGALLEDAGLTSTNGTPTSTEFSDSGTSGSSTGGYQTIVLEVRNGGSGTTYATQGFLAISGDTAYDSFSDSEALWPKNGYVTDGCTPSNAASACTTAGYSNGDDNGAGTYNSGSSQLVKNVLGDPGTIGYANFADAATDVTGDTFTDVPQATTYGSSVSHQYLYANIEDNYEGPSAISQPTPSYAAPGKVDTATSVVTVTPNVYTGSSINTTGGGGVSGYSFTQTNVGDWNVPSSGGAFDPTGSWQDTLAGDPDILGHGGGSRYPIVASTYDVAWSDYTGGNLTDSGYYNSSANATAIGYSVISYLAYLAGTGQSDLASGRIGYAELPLSIDNDAKLAEESIMPTSSSGSVEEFALNQTTAEKDHSIETALRVPAAGKLAVKATFTEKVAKTVDGKTKTVSETKTFASETRSVTRSSRREITLAPSSAARSYLKRLSDRSSIRVKVDATFTRAGGARITRSATVKVKGEKLAKRD